MARYKIINDPIHGFIQINDPLFFRVIEHPYFQRLRRIQQLGFTNLVYPGATHSRFHHALGAMHLTDKAIQVLRSKDISITAGEERGVKLAILLHDIGHGPFSHALERCLLPLSHEQISLRLMEEMNREFLGELDLAMDIFLDRAPKRFLHQLVSGQLDMDRLDYLSRDSFYTGVSEGIVGLERIIQMLHVHNDQLVVEEKGIYSIEKFIVARRLMYWQVYLHKTTLAADAMLLNALDRAKGLFRIAGPDTKLSPSLNQFLCTDALHLGEQELKAFVQLDDHDLMMAIKVWSGHSDPILSHLCRNLLNRRLFKTKFYPTKPTTEELQICLQEIIDHFSFIQDEQSAKRLMYSGVVQNEAYSVEGKGIHILMKDGTVRDIADASDNYNIAALRSEVEKFYICAAK